MPNRFFSKFFTLSLLVVSLLFSFVPLVSFPVAARQGAPERSLYFTSERDGNSEIYVMGESGENTHRLTDGPAADWGPSVSPDGSRVVFVSDRDGGAAIYVMNADGTDVQQLTSGSSATWPAWSPNGTLMSFLAESNGQLEVHVLNLEDGSTSQVTEIGVAEGRMAWSPDGTSLAFASNQEGFRTIYVVRLQDGEARALSDDVLEADNPAWSPDGTRIAFDSTRDGDRDIFVTEIATGRTRRLTDHTAADRFPAWSPDGARIAFQSDRSGIWQLYSMSASGGGTRQLAISDANDLHPVWAVTLSGEAAVAIPPIPAAAIATTGDLHFSGSISQQVYEEKWTVEGQAGEIVNVYMEAVSGDLDPYLALYDSDGEMLIADDDSGGNKNSAFRIELPASGTYTVVATRFGGELGTTSGDYTLRITRGAEPAAAAPGVSEMQPVDNPIAVGQEVVASISNQRVEHRWSVEGVAGETITVQMETLSGNLDPYLELLAPDGVSLMTDDDGAGGKNSAISLELPEAGWFTIVATRFGRELGNTSGDFRLTLLRGVPGVDDAQAMAPANRAPASLCPGAPPSPFLVGDTAAILGGNRPVYSQPNANSTRLVTLLETAPFVIEDGPACTDGQTWWQIRTMNGFTGWIPEQVGLESYIRTCPAVAVPDYGLLCPDTPPSRLREGQRQMRSIVELNVRSTASPRASVRGELRFYELVDVLNGPVCSDGFLWWEIRSTETGLTGWAAEVSPSEWLMVPEPWLGCTPGAVTATTPAACEGAVPPRLTVGQAARVTPGRPNNLRDAPSLQSRILTTIPGGTPFDVLTGPTCVDGYNWWQLNYQGFVGWTAEGASGEYWLEPMPASANPSQPITNTDASSCDGRPTRFAVGESVVVTSIGNGLRILNRPGGGALNALAQGNPGDVLDLIGGPVCGRLQAYNEGTWYWHVYSRADRVLGWVAEGPTTEQWICPTSDPGCLPQ